MNADCYLKFFYSPILQISEYQKSHVWNKNNWVLSSSLLSNNFGVCTVFIWHLGLFRLTRKPPERVWNYYLLCVTHVALLYAFFEPFKCHAHSHIDRYRTVISMSFLNTSVTVTIWALLLLLIVFTLLWKRWVNILMTENPFRQNEVVAIWSHKIVIAEALAWLKKNPISKWPVWRGPKAVKTQYFFECI